MLRTREVTSLALGLAMVVCAAAGCAHGGQSAADWQEADDPNSIVNRDRPAPGPVEKQKYFMELRAAESANPDSVDSRLPSAASILQRLEAFNQGALERARLAQARGGERVAPLGSRLVQERGALEGELRGLAEKLNVDLEELSDRRAVDQQAADRGSASSLAQVQAGRFDLRFAEQERRAERQASAALGSLRGRCVEPRVCELISRMIPIVDGDQLAVSSLSSSLAQGAGAR